MSQRSITSISALCFFFTLTCTVNGETTESIVHRKMYSIKEIKQAAASLDNKDIPVCLVGYMTKPSGGKKHLFFDSTDTISIDIYPSPSDTLFISDTTKVLLSGEVDNDVLEGIEIKVRYFWKAGPE